MSFSMIQSAYKSSNGKNMINYYIYKDDNVKAKAIIQISHGMCEYIARYEEFAKYLTKYGYIVCGNDHLGHGNSISKYDELGFFGKNGEDLLKEDLYKLTKIMKDKYQDIPIILMGHSMGSFIARYYIEEYSKDIDGCILSGTSAGYVLLPLAKKIAKYTQKVCGPYHRSRFVKMLADIKSTARYKNGYIKEFDWLTRDRNIIDKYKNDRRCNFNFTLDGYCALFSVLEKVNCKDWGKNTRKDLPILVFSGDKDPVGDFGKGVKKVYNTLKDLNFSDLKLKLYPDGRHEMLNEINNQEVYKDILEWLECRYNT